MKSDERGMFPWLIEDVYHTRASIRYEIILEETRLHQFMAFNLREIVHNKHAIDCCMIIIRLYSTLLLISSSEVLCIESEPSMENEHVTCYCKIQELKSQMYSATSLKQKVLVMHDLIFYYKNLKSLLSQAPETHCHTLGISNALNGLIQAVSPESWLAAVVDFAREVGDNTSLHYEQLIRLNDNELLSIYGLFIREEYVALINCLFFYKLNPERLYRQLMHPEMLISTKARLGMLHAFIEFVHQSVIQILCQRGIHAEKDYLFHGNEIPQGIDVEEEHKFKELIVLAIKKWRLTQLFYSDEIKTFGKIDEIFRAYKFWFNPDRLIDAVMSLRAELAVSNLYNTEDTLYFTSQIRLLYKQVSTNQCIDLYGYFSNKDSCYLMRTLMAGFKGSEIDAGPLLSESDKMAIEQVYISLDCMMNSLRDELQHRHISTAPYLRSNHGKVAPGRRNLQALRRILELYHDDKKGRNVALEQLFNELQG